jgi:hypothetical protein
MALTALELEDPHRLAQIDRQFKSWIADDDFRHAREMAMFYIFLVRDEQLAHETAQANWSIQKEPIDRYLLQVSTL